MILVAAVAFGTIVLVTACLGFGTYDYLRYHWGEESTDLIKISDSYGNTLRVVARQTHLANKPVGYAFHVDGPTGQIVLMPEVAADLAAVLAKATKKEVEA